MQAKPQPHRYVPVALFLIIAANLAEIWSFHYFPSADGPSHLEMAATISQLWRGLCPNLNSLYHFTHAVTPNWVTYFLLIPLMHFFTGAVAEKIVVSLYVIFLPLAVYKFIKTTNPTSAPLAIPACLLLSNYLLYSGSYSFLLSLVFYIYSLHWFIHNRENLSTKNCFILLFLFTANYLFHLCGFVFFAISIFVILTSEIKATGFRTYVKRGLFSFLAACPSLAALAQYMSLPKPPISGDASFIERVIYTLFPTTFITSNADIYLMYFITISLALLLFYICTLKQRTNSKFLGWLALTFTLLLLFGPFYFAGGWLVETRLQLYILLIFIFWLAAFNHSKLFLRIIVCASLPALLVQIWLTIPIFTKYNRIAAEYVVENSRIPNNSTIFAADISPFTIDYASNETNTRYSYSHLAGYLVANKTCVAEISNYHLGEQNSFPITYRDATNPNMHLGQFRTNYGLQIIPPQINLDTYPIKPDYILIKGSRENLFKYPAAYGLDEQGLYNNFMQQITRNYRLEYESPDLIYKIYRPK